MTRRSSRSEGRAKAESPKHKKTLDTPRSTVVEADGDVRNPRIFN